jgi:site-specific DNA-methyltransferase (adenine-specific)
MDIQGDGWKVLAGSCLDRLLELEDNSIDAVVTDPPYELGFMGKSWDSSGIAYNVEVWRQCLRVLKPGGHILAFGGSRTWHRLAVAVEDAGFEIRDSIAWIYGSGFPKSLDVSKAIDKAAGAEREVVGSKITGGIKRARPDNSEGFSNPYTVGQTEVDVTAPATAEAQKWQGWGTALKPAFEPVVVGRKPLTGTVAVNVLEWGVGGLNIDGTRIPHASVNDLEKHSKGVQAMKERGGVMADSWKNSSDLSGANDVSSAGRWPSNVMLDEYTASLVDEQQEEVSRFFYVAKASKRDRNEGLDGLEDKAVGSLNMRTDSHAERNGETTAPAKNFHPTVKPTDLMRNLIRLVTPLGGTVLDPFTGSGSTGKAAILEGMQFVGCELTPEYLPIIEGRINYAVSVKEQEALAEDEKLF